MDIAKENMLRKVEASVETLAHSFSILLSEYNSFSFHWIVKKLCTRRNYYKSGKWDKVSPQSRLRRRLHKGSPVSNGDRTKYYGFYLGVQTRSN